MNEIMRLPLGALATNCYVVPVGENRAVAVDPASSGEVMAVLDANETELAAIIITHGHFDHFAGAAALQKQTNVPIYAPELDSEMFQSADKSWAWFMGGVQFAPITPEYPFTDGESFSICGTEFVVKNAPGHTAGSCLLFCEKYDCIFAGDVIFRGSTGRTDGYSGSVSQLCSTLKAIKAIEHNYKLLCGHGECTDILTEKLTNPYLLDV